jgi:hypothetical protein
MSAFGINQMKIAVERRILESARLSVRRRFCFGLRGQVAGLISVVCGLHSPTEKEGVDDGWMCFTCARKPSQNEHASDVTIPRAGSIRYKWQCQQDHKDVTFVDGALSF